MLKDPDDTLNPLRWAELWFDPVQPPTYRRLSQDPAVNLEQLYLGRGSDRSATDLLDLSLCCPLPVFKLLHFSSFVQSDRK